MDQHGQKAIDHEEVNIKGVQRFTTKDTKNTKKKK